MVRSVQTTQKINPVQWALCSDWLIPIFVNNRCGNNIYCIYKAENEELLREHAKKGGFPANNITQVANIISPATAS